MKVIVSNIQRFCLNDGPGIRTTVFFKGCNLRCPWCCNPENIDFEIQEYLIDGIKNAYGKEYSLDELEKLILKDKDYYENNGGVTFSGGECLLQFKKIEPLLKNLKNQNINICIETALNVPSDFVDIALKYVDEFYIDIKLLNQKGKKTIGEDSNLYVKNLKKIIEKNNNVVIRMPIVPEYTYTRENINEIIKLLKKIKIKNMEIFKIHRLGEKKYNILGLKMPRFKEVTEVEMQNLKKEFERYADNVKIIKI